MKYIILFLFGVTCGSLLIYFLLYPAYTFSVEANEFKYELIEAYHDALDDAKVIIDKHNIIDKDTTEDIDSYIRSTAKVDSLLLTQL